MTYCFQFHVVYFWTVLSKKPPAMSWCQCMRHVKVRGTLSKMDVSSFEAFYSNLESQSIVSLSKYIKYGGPQGSNTLKLENTFHHMKTNFSSLKQIVFDVGKYNSNFKNSIQISKTQFRFKNTFQISKTQFKLQKHISNCKNTIQLSKTHFKS